MQGELLCIQSFSHHPTLIATPAQDHKAYLHASKLFMKPPTLNQIQALNYLIRRPLGVHLQEERAAVALDPMRLLHHQKTLMRSPLLRGGGGTFSLGSVAAGARPRPPDVP